MHQHIALLQSSCCSSGNAYRQAQLQDIFSVLVSMLRTCDAGITPLDDVIRLRQNRIGPMPYYLGAVLLSLRRRCPFRGHLELKIERYELKEDMQCDHIQLSMLILVYNQLSPEHIPKQHGTMLQSTMPTSQIATLEVVYTQAVPVASSAYDLPAEQQQKDYFSSVRKLGRCRWSQEQSCSNKPCNTCLAIFSMATSPQTSPKICRKSL